ncbi:MAG: hypothetical protein SGJ09_04505 [Phycisphaerae bacterium]|nr:hypothetical protein [Phycisphaerae bacterium]
MTITTIQIEGMKGELCVKEVDKALRELNGVEVKSVAVGSAVVDCSTAAACDACCAAIDDAGYTARESPSRGAETKANAGAKAAPTRDSGNSKSTSGTSPSKPHLSSAQQPDPTRAGSPGNGPRGTAKDDPSARPATRH